MALFILVFSVIAWFGTVALAVEDSFWQPINRDELLMTKEPRAPGAAAICLYRQVDRDDSRGLEFNYIRIKILAEEGRKYADVEIPFSAGLQKVRGIAARTIQPDGTTSEFKGKVYEQTIVKAKGSRVLADTFTLPGVRVGTIIDLAYTLDFLQRPSILNGLVYGGSLENPIWVLSTDLFTKRAKFSLKPQEQMGGLRWGWPNGLPAGTEAPSAQGRVIRLEAQNIPAFVTEDYMPPEDSLNFLVEFEYTSGFPETDPDKFWEHRGKIWDGVFEDFVSHKKKDLERAVRVIVSDGEPPEIKLQKLYARALQVRNLSYEKPVSFQEAKREKLKAIKNAEDVWSLGYGDATEINWLFIALARAAGIDATSVFIAPRNSYFFDPKTLNTGQLSDDIVLVKLGTQDLYLDPGAKFAPFGILPWFETDAPGLALNNEGGKWVRTPAPGSAQALIQRKADLTLSADGSLEGKLAVSYGGLEALELRTVQRDSDDAGRRDSLEALIKDSIPAFSEVELTNHPDWNSANMTMVAEFHLKVTGWTSGAGSGMLFPIGLFGGDERHVFEHSDRVHPVYFHHSYLRSDELTVHLPKGWKASQVPLPFDRDAKVVFYSINGKDDNNDMSIHRTLKSELLWVEPERYGWLRSIFESIRNGDSQQILLLPNK